MLTLFKRYRFINNLILLLLLSPAIVLAAPGDNLYSENFNGNLNDWVIDASGGGDASIASLAAEQGDSLQLRWNAVSVTSAAAIDTQVPGATVSVWVRRGDDDFSEDPDANENLIIEYLNDAGSYMVLETFAGDGAPGEIYNRVYALPDDGLHNGMRVRISQTAGNGSDWDYWHVDSLSVDETSGPTSCVSDGSVVAGLFATYYDQDGISRAYFTGNTVTQFDAPVNFNWGSGAPLAGFPRDNFSVTWEGQVEANETGAHVFSTVSDDGVRLYVDGNLVIDNFTDHGPRRDLSGSINLQAGNQYDLRMEFYERGGGAVAQLEWDGPSFGRQIIPAANLSHGCRPPVPPPCEGGEIETNGLLGNYYDQNAIARNYFTGNVETRLDLQVNFDWGGGTPIVGFANDDFSIIWEGEVETRDAGNYIFSTVSDDGVRLYIDGNLVVDNFTDHGSRRDSSAFINLQAASRYTVRMEYYERGGGAVAQLEWSGPTFARELIPTRQLFAECPALESIAEFGMEESQWTGANGEVTDESGNAFNGTALGDAVTLPLASTTAAITGNPGTCGYGDFPLNTSAAIIDAVDTGVDVDTDVGSTGTIALWYRSNTAWAGGIDRQIFDAAKRQGLKYFFLTLSGDGRLRFGLEDSADGDFRYSSPVQNIAADVWTHITVTWDLPNDEFLMYINGALVSSYTPNTNGTIGDQANLLIGDNNGDYIINGDTTGNSANGAIDEVNIFDRVLSVARIDQVMNKVRACAPIGPDHIEIVVSGNASTCVAKDIEIRACLDAACSALFTNYTGTVQLDTSTANGTWSYAGGPGNLVAGASDSGTAAFEFVAANDGTATLQLSNTRAESLTIDGSDTLDATLTATSAALSFSDNAFVISDIDPFTEGTAGADIAVAGRDHLYRVEMVRRDTNQNPSICGVVTAYNNPAQALKVWLNRPQLVSAAAAQINTVALPNALPLATNISLDFSAGGTANFVLQSSDVGQFSIELVDDSRSFANNVDIVGSSNRLLVRPFGFDVDFIVNGAADRATNGTAGISYAQNGSGIADPDASVFAVAGSNFTTQISAVQWQGSDDINGDGVPDSGANLSDNLLTPSFGQEQSPETVTLSRSLVAPSSGAPGQFTVTSVTAFTAGRSQQIVSFSEVGIIHLQASLADSDYLGSGINITGEANNVGRFIPARFELNGTALVDEACAAGVFTYLGQEFTVSYELLAVNEAGDTTENYTGSFVKLTNLLGTLAMGAADNANNINLSNRLPPAGDIINNSAFIWGPDMGASLGAGEIETRLTLDRLLTPDGQHLATLGVLPTDDDNVTVTAVNLDVDNDGANDFVTLGDSVQRYGRVFLENAFGPEERELEMFFIAQYFDSTLGVNGGFVPNRDDSCTDYSAADFAELAGSYSGNLSAGDTGISGTSDTIYNAGAGSVLLAAPNADNDGSVNIQFTVPVFLQFDWDGDASTVDTSPINTATFGSFRGNDRVIYRREVGR